MPEEPPLFNGAVNVTAAEPLPRVADTPVGGSGTVAGVTAFEGDDSALFPTKFVACTVNVYTVPLVRPVTLHGLTEHDATVPPGDAVATKPVITEPPLLVGAENETVAELLARVAETLAGESGTVAGVTGADTDDSVLSPSAFVA